MKEETFNRWFNIFIIAGMAIATIIITALEYGKSSENNILLLVTAFGSIMGVLCNVCSANGKIWTFLFGFFDVSIYAVLCFIGRNYGNGLLYALYFLPMQFIGFAQWRKRGASSDEQVEARRFSPKQWLLYSSIFIVGTIIAYLILAKFDKSGAESFLKAAVVFDAVSMMCNLIGQLLMTFAYMEQWIFWIGVNVFTIAMWFVSLKESADSYAIVLMVKYIFFFLNSLNGLRIWINLSKEPAVLNK